MTESTQANHTTSSIAGDPVTVQMLFFIIGAAVVACVLLLIVCLIACLVCLVCNRSKRQNGKHSHVIEQANTSMVQVLPTSPHTVKLNATTYPPKGGYKGCMYNPPLLNPQLLK